MLTGEAKKLYQREYMRAKRAKNVRPLAESVRPIVPEVVRPTPEPSVDRHDSQPVLDLVRPDVRPVPDNMLPIYDPMIHKAGDRVLVKVGKVYEVHVVPELDADGHLIRGD